MRRRALAILAPVLLGSGPLRDAVSAADRVGIEAAISAQIEAFRRDDAAAAHALAAPAVRALFPTAELFLRMVQSAYAPVHRPRAVRFGEASADGGDVVQRVVLQGRDGRTHLALCTMERQADGAWLIARVVLLTPPERGS